MTRTDVVSSVSSATVYRGRALVARKAVLKLEPGEHTLAFTGLPSSLDRNSLQVRGTGEAVLGGCVFEREHFTEDVNELAGELLAKKLELGDKLESLEMDLKRLEGERVFLEKIAQCVTTPLTRDGKTEPEGGTGQCVQDVSVWDELSSFHSRRHAAIDTAVLEKGREKRRVNREVARIDAELKTLGHRKTSSRDIVKVMLKKKTPGELALELSYTVPGPTWKPVYSIRAAGGKDELLLEYDALVIQATGEDWKDIDLKLSTARIGMSGVMPELAPWRIGFYTPPPPQAAPGMKRMRSAKKAEAEEMDMCLSEEPAVGAAAYEPAPIAVNEAEVEQAGSSVLFTVPGLSGLKGDNSETRVTLARGELPAEYLYRSVPKLSEFAYLTAKLTNGTGYPLLPGKANVFLDGSLVSSTSLALIMPGQETDVSLGVDEGIKVEYQFLKKFRKNEGLINKRTSMQFEYSIKLANNTGREVDMEVFDQFPISQDKELEVKAVRPDPRKEQDEVKIDGESKIAWKLRLAPSEKRELPVSYLVEYPVDRTLAGL